MNLHSIISTHIHACIRLHTEGAGCILTSAPPSHKAGERPRSHDKHMVPSSKHTQQLPTPSINLFCPSHQQELTSIILKLNRSTNPRNNRQLSLVCYQPCPRARHAQLTALYSCPHHPGWNTRWLATPTAAPHAADTTIW